MIEVLLVKNLLEEKSERRYVAADLLSFFKEHFGRFPVNTRIYHSVVSVDTDVTPRDEEGAAALATMPGPFVVVICPGEGVSLAVILQIISVAITVAAIVFAPMPPVVTQRNVQTESPNNGLAGRSNRARPKARRPDAYGTNRMYPDQITEPTTRFIDHREVEDSYLALGRGWYEIQNAANGRPDIRDDKTAIHQIAGSSVEVYAPFTSPGHGEPTLRIGNAINQPIVSSQRLSAVNGQTLLAADAGGSYRNPVKFLSPNIIQSHDPLIDYTAMFVSGDQLVISEAVQTEGEEVYQATEGDLIGVGLTTAGRGAIAIAGDLSVKMAVGHVVTIKNVGVAVLTIGGGESESTSYINLDGIYSIYDLVVAPGEAPGSYVTTLELSDVAASNAYWNVFLSGGAAAYFGAVRLSRAGGVVQFELDGTYTVNTLTSTQITLNDPAEVNLAWNTLEDSFGGESKMLTPRLNTNGDRNIGPFLMQATGPITGFQANFVCQQGLYADNGQQQYPQTVSVRLEATPTDDAGTPLEGAVPEVFEGSIVGSGTTRSIRALTMEGTFAAVSSNWLFTARRTSPSNVSFVGQVVDEVKWRDLWGTSPTGRTHFGNVTTIQSRRLATDGALAIKNPQLNVLGTRMLPRRVSGSEFTTELYATNDMADILSAICLDPYIGNRSPADIDFDNFYDTQAQIKAYFGFDEASHFSYTFDKSNISAEETVATVAAAVFCTPYRRGRVIRTALERETEDSAMLFNHRNKRPGSEKRSYQFGRVKKNDGVEYTYVNPLDDTVTTLYRPEDRSALNPKKVEGVGVRNLKQAMIAADREWNKIQYMNTTTVFDAMPEANLLARTERILCANNVRPNSQDGEIVSVDGLEVELSQPMAWTDGESYSMWLQNDDLHVESIPISAGRSNRHAVLARAPRRPLVSSPMMYAKTTYIIVNGAGSRHAAPFLISEKGQPNDDATIPMTAINYDPRYYQGDGAYRPT